MDQSFNSNRNEPRVPAGGQRLRSIMAVARKASILCGASLILYGVSRIAFTSLTYDGANELIGGRSDTQAIVVPLAIFLLGGIALALGIGGPRDRPK